MLSFLSPAVSLLYHESCVVCGADGDVICGHCAGEFRAVEDGSVCPVCGRWLGVSMPCGECSGTRRWFAKGTFGFYYEGKLREAIHAFKFNGNKRAGRRLVRMAEDKISALSGTIDCIVPVPVTEKRLRERGFNQSFIIAGEVSDITGAELLHRTLVKKVQTSDQSSLSRRERKKNIKGAFMIRDGRHVEGRRILLVDDLFTTGYTAGEAARTLKAAGCRSVAFFALARTP